MSDALLRATAASVFASAPGRHYWQNAGAFWRDNYSGRRARRFHRSLEKTYQEALKKPPPIIPAAAPERPRDDRWWVFVLAAIGGAVVAARAVRRTLRGR